MNWKKKLGALVPGEARAHLQNALTVDWDGHKTVLVDVPQARKDEDLELSGFDRGQYGRLDDEDDGEFVKARLGRGRSSTTSHAPTSPVAHTRSESTPSHPKRFNSNNPFANPFDHEEDYAAAAAVLPPPPRKGSGAGSVPDHARARPPPLRPQDIWDDLGAKKSPTSSTGSTGSSSVIARPSKLEDDPFYSDRRC